MNTTTLEDETGKKEPPKWNPVYIPRTQTRVSAKGSTGGQADMKVYIRTNDYTYHYSHFDYNIPDYFCIEKNGRKNDFTEYYGDRFPQIDK